MNYNGQLIINTQLESNQKKNLSDKQVKKIKNNFIFKQEQNTYS